jgi:hypothetical protein
MRFPPNWSMELLLVLALFASVIVTIFALQAPPGDRTRFTLERSDVTQIVGERRIPIVAEETALGR